VVRADRINNVDLAISALIVASQCVIAYCLFADGKPRLSRPLFGVVLGLFWILWTITAIGIFLHLLRSPDSAFQPPTAIYAFVSAVEVLWGFTSTIVVAIYMGARSLLKQPHHSAGRRRFIKAAAAAAMATPVAAMTYGGLVERNNFHVRETDFPIPNLHPDFEGFTIAQISDLHVSPYLSVRDAARVVDITNELKPRLTLMTGDLISQRGDPLDETIAELARLRADVGILGCLGNHEVYAGCEDYTEQQARRRGLDFLRMSSRRIHWGSGELNFAGVDYQPFYTRAHYLTGADKLIVTGVPNILLSHNPDVFPTAVKQGYQGVISGHTHGGQVTVEILRQTLNVVRVATPYVAGLYRKDGASCYVTAGIGTIGMPVRLGAPPEITLLRLRRA
jgi:predicted MPP superfamily phosphohydrolase